MPPRGAISHRAADATSERLKEPKMRKYGNFRYGVMALSLAAAGALAVAATAIASMKYYNETHGSTPIRIAPVRRAQNNPSEYIGA